MVGIWDIVINFWIFDFVQDIIGENIICWVSVILLKCVGDLKWVLWYQDVFFWGLSLVRIVMVWLVIDDVDEENVVMWFILGSYDRGVVEILLMGENLVFYKGIVEVEWFGVLVFNSLKVGQILFYVDMFIYGLELNILVCCWCGLMLCYCLLEV